MKHKAFGENRSKHAHLKCNLVPMNEDAIWTGLHAERSMRARKTQLDPETSSG
jgi:hypothetical protein